MVVQYTQIGDIALHDDCKPCYTVRVTVTLTESVDKRQRALYIGYAFLVCFKCIRTRHGV